MDRREQIQAELRSLKAELASHKANDGTLKIVLNGTFGKTSNQYSILYNPKMMLHTTLGGQLSILMLIEGLEQLGIPVVSANTDGIMVKYPARFRDRILRVIGENAKRTGYEYEETTYKTVAMANVNNYLAVCADRTPAIITPDGVTDGHASPER